MDRSESLVRSLLLAALLAFGALVVNMFGWMMTGTIFESVFSGDQINEHLQVRITGEVIRNISSTSGRYVERRTLDGQVFKSDEGEDPRQIANGVGLGLNWVNRERANWLPSFQHSEPTASGRTYWYVRRPSPESDRFYLEGYSGETFRRTGCLSRSGFSSARPLEQEMWQSRSGYLGFTSNWARRADAQNFIPASDGIWRVDLRSLKSELILPGIVTDSFGQVVLDPAGQTDGSSPPRIGLAVRQQDAIQIFDARTLQPREIPLTPVQRAKSITLYTLTEDRLLLMVQGDRVEDTELSWIGADGKTTRQETVTLQRQRGGFNNTPAEVAGLMVATVIPCPVVIVGAVSMNALMELAQGIPISVLEPEDRPIFFSSVLALITFSVVSAWLCHRHAKRYHVRHRTAWVLFTLAFGVAGLVGYWCHRRWPVLPISEWVTTGKTTPPALKGTEVFA